MFSSAQTCPYTPVLTDQQGTVSSGEAGGQTTEDPARHNHLNMGGESYHGPASRPQHTGGQDGSPGPVTTSAVAAQQGAANLTQDFTAR